MPDRHQRLPWRALTVLGLLVLAAATSSAQNGEDAVLQRLKKDITFLASDECEGRGIDTKGINKAADYIVNELKKAGLKPGGKDGTFFQPFVVGAGGGKVEGVNTLTLRGPLGQVIELQPDKDFKVLPTSGGKVEAPIVFAGYGLSAPEIGYDDFKGVDLTGKVIVVLRRTPRWDNKFAEFGGNQTAHQGFEAKIGNAELHKAAAVLLVNDRSEAGAGDPFMTLPGGLVSGGLPVMQLRRGVADMMFVASKGATLQDVERDIDRDLKPRSVELKSWTASLDLPVKRDKIALKNVVGVLDGAGPLANETVIAGAIAVTFSIERKHASLTHRLVF